MSRSCFSPYLQQFGAVMVLVLLFSLAGCSTFGDRVAPIPAPDSQQSRVEVGGVKFVANSYLDADASKRSFGFDARGAGLLPIMVVVDNQSGSDVRIRGSQTFLIDAQEQAWPLLSTEQANQRVANHVEVGETAKGAGKPGLLLGAAGALAGAAIGVVTGENVAEAAGRGAVLGGAAGALGGGFQRNQRLQGEVRDGLAQRNLRNQRINPGELGYGFLFFPGADEARSATRLRLAVEIGEQSQVIQVPTVPAASGDR